MEESGIRRSLLDVIANETVPTCTSGGLQTSLDFVTIMKLGIGLVTIIISVYVLYQNLRWICIPATNRPPIQQDASQNAPDLEMGRPPLGFAESSNASNDGTITLPEASSRTPGIIQEVLASGVQALEIASQLTVSG
ncbi:unnamed protein product [Sphagnum jensenii]|uniref:Uncharacterized protein n=1 Tax=Sphagnum jensenii TaxID=128206 RepID=A0ABP1AMP7_9BRYO